MRLRMLQALHAVMETGSVSEAGQRLYRTQPQVSRTIANLEAELGFKLFIRHKQRLIPTREGRQFYEEARRILVGMDQIAAIAEDIRARAGGRLRIIAQPYLAYSIVPKSLATFLETEPGLKVSLEVRSRRDVASWVAGSQFDIGLAALPVETPAVVAEVFATVPVVAAMHAGHPLAARPCLTAEEVASQPLVALGSFTLLRRQVDALFEGLGLALDIRAEAASGLSACQLAAEGVGITLTDPLIARALPADALVLRPWTPGIVLTYGIIYPEAHPPTPLVRRFVDVVARTAEDFAPTFIRRV